MINKQLRTILLTAIGLMLLTFCVPVDSSSLSLQHLLHPTRTFLHGDASVTPPIARVTPAIIQVTEVGIPLTGTIMIDRKGGTPYPTLAAMDMPIMQLRPDFIQAVAPKEYRKVPLDLYNDIPEGIVGYGIGAFDLGISSSLEPGYQSAICVRPLARLLVQEGDDFGSTRKNEEMFKERMELFVDGEVREMTQPTIDKGLLEVVGNWETVWIEGADYCWAVSLDIGSHKVTFRYHQTSGNIREYTWYFEIVD